MNQYPTNPYKYRPVGVLDVPAQSADPTTEALIRAVLALADAADEGGIDSLYFAYNIGGVRYAAAAYRAAHPVEKDDG